MVDATSAPLLSASDKLAQIAAQLTEQKRPEPVTVRELLRWFDAQRRGLQIVRQIRRALSRAKLKTNPDFEGAYIDGLIEFISSKTLATIRSDGSVTLTEGPAPVHEVQVAPPYQEAARISLSDVKPDPTYRIGKLHSANRVPVSVKPTQTITEAVTIMLANDFSQLPVMIGERDVKGIVSWASIGRSLALGGKRNDTEVKECMDPAHIISADKSLFDAINEIVSNQYVLIQDSSRKISGIVTTSDLSFQFHQMTEPFLLLGEIENHVRNIIEERGHFTTETLQKFRNPSDTKQIDGVSDLTFGDYIALLGNEECWSNVSVPVDRKIFIGNLERVRRIRNEVMHFDPDGVSDDDLDTLRKFTGFLQRLQITLTPRSKDLNNIADRSRTAAE